MQVGHVFRDIWINLRRTPTMSVALVVTLAISLTFIGSGLLGRDQVTLMKGYWYDKVEVTVYLCGTSSSNANCLDASGNAVEVTQAQRNNLNAELHGDPDVKQVFYETKDEAYARFKTQFQDQSPELVKSTPPSALPESYRVKLKHPDDYSAITSAFTGQPGVDDVVDQKKLLSKFFKVLNNLQLAALVVAGLQLIAAILLIGNTIRVAAFTRRHETGIMRLVGASNTYIRLPFLLEGALAGLIGGGIAAGLLCLGKWLLVDKVLRPSIQFTTWIGWHPVYRTIPALLAVGVVVAVGSSFVSIRRHLRV